MKEKTARTRDEKLAAIRMALAPFKQHGMTDAQQDKAAEAILKALDHWPSHSDFTESAGYLDFYGKAQAVVEKFKDHGLTMEKWVKACCHKPALFPQSADKTETNIRGVVEAFASKGLTLKKYLATPCMEPSRFIDSPQTIIDNIREMGKTEWTSTVDYLEAAIKHPQLFCRKPETMKRRIEMLVGLQEQGLLCINWRNKQLSPRANLIHMLLTSPTYLCISDDNILQRLALALVHDEPLSMKQLYPAKDIITQGLAKYLNSLDHKLPEAKETELPCTKIETQSIVQRGKVAAGEELLISLAKRGVLDKALAEKVIAHTGSARG